MLLGSSSASLAYKAPICRWECTFCGARGLGHVASLGTDQHRRNGGWAARMKQKAGYDIRTRRGNERISLRCPIHL